jgi:hypothetical protein
VDSNVDGKPDLIFALVDRSAGAGPRPADGGGRGRVLWQLAAIGHQAVHDPLLLPSGRAEDEPIPDDEDAAVVAVDPAAVARGPRRGDGVFSTSSGCR